MTTALYAVILSLLLCHLSMNVIKCRRKNRVLYADGDCKELIIARTAQSNAIDYCPMTLLLLLFLELNGGNIWLIHAIGITFVIGRVIHSQGILKEKLKGRVRGMQITFYMIYLLAAVNLVYLPYEKFIPA